MAKRSYHNRKMGFGAYEVGVACSANAFMQPTSAQRKFYLKLYAMCKQNGLEVSKSGKTRVSYSKAIDEMILRLNQAAVEDAPKLKTNPHCAADLMYLEAGAAR